MNNFPLITEHPPQQCQTEVEHRPSPEAPFEIQVLRDLAEVNALRAVWQRLCSDPNADIDFYVTILQSRPEVLRPHVVVLKRNGTASAILAGRLEKASLDVRLGYKTVTLAPVRRLTLIHGGLLGVCDEAETVAMVDSILRSLREGEADLAWFYGMDSRSALNRAAYKAGGALLRDYFSVSNHSLGDRPAPQV